MGPGISSWDTSMIRLGDLVRHRTDADDEPPGLVTERREYLDRSTQVYVQWERQAGALYCEQELVVVGRPRGATWGA